MTRLKLSYVHEYRDRQGRLRRYARRPGHRQIALPGMPGSPEFMEVYQAAMAGTFPVKGSRHKPGTLAALATDFFASIEFSNLKASSQATYRVTLDPILQKDGHRLARDLPPEKATKIIQEIGAKAPGMANLTRAVLHRIFKLAISQRLRADNPFAGVAKYKLGTHHTWTDAEIEAYEKHWPLGTRERLAFALLLYTGQRVGDVVRMQRSDIQDGAIHVVQDKTEAELHIQLHPALARAIKAGPSKGFYLVGDANGRPIRRATLSALISDAATAAGLPRICVAHGLRKASLRRLAEVGSTSKQIQAVSGHRSLTEVERYTRKADQRLLAKTAIGLLPDKG